MEEMEARGEGITEGRTSSIPGKLFIGEDDAAWVLCVWWQDLHERESPSMVGMQSNDRA
jgi:hypothetical protein